MAFTQQEIKFLEDNRNLIEEGESSLSKVLNLVLDTPAYGDFTRGKMIFAIVYSVQGVSGFSAMVSSEYEFSRIKGALLNRTAVKADGVALLPSMFKNGTKIVYYRIENNSIVEEKKSKLVDMSTYKDELNKGNYNLVVLDTPDSVKSVKEAFGGTIKVTTRFIANLVRDRGSLHTVIVRGTDPSVIKEETKAGLIKGLVAKLDGMASTIESVVNSVIDKTDFKI